MAYTTSPRKNSFRSAAKKSIHSLFKSPLTASLSSEKANNDRTNSRGSIVENVPEEERVEVGDGGWSAQETTSERGTACTEPRVPHTSLPAQPGPQSPESQSQSREQYSLAQQLESPHPSMQLRLSGYRKGNVQIHINGRYIPQLDMMFSKRGNGKFSSSLYLGGSSDVESTADNEPTCRFVNGTLRPSTEILDALVENGFDEPTTERTCSCHESIRKGEHHLCAQQNGQSIRPAGDARGPVLIYGRNLLRYNLFSERGAIVATAEAHLYLWRSSDSVVISDVDGTVTKSDVRGVIDTVVQDRFEYCHAGICKFYNEILDVGGGNDDEHGEEDGLELFARGDGRDQLALPQSTDDRRDGEIRFLYLSSRPISLVNQTRKLLVSLSQTGPFNEVYGLPPGPILCHTGSLSSVLFSELWAKNIYEFKADVLARQVVLPFVAARGEDWKPTNRGKFGDDDCVQPSLMRNTSVTEEEEDAIEDKDNGDGRTLSGMSEASSFWDDRLLIAGFGNKTTDAMAYEMAGIDRRDIYIIDKESRILCMGVDTNYSVISSFQSTPSSSAVANLTCDQSEWLTNSCCPGVEGRAPSELAMPVENKNSALFNSNKVVTTSIQPIERSLPGERQPETSENFPVSTDVDVYITNEQNQPVASVKSLQKRSKVRQSIRAFSSKRRSFTKFPSFASVSSNASKSSPKKLYEGYEDPLLLSRMRERMLE
eukprot:CAMPEP_0172549584 /NCGR_PEP_ID=MMETSP1067-20121228/18610_1 /TAXON_ID=265564 ORGANISM="Thalassiosira punctigera, Strain Tpunct2005C2" /NCGR_SAMPLE_ID=MMETSP1067 /ASSEMBLY_ACC=CAM_ASM_000444 /LENGTH=711 /DNA_ID=CAMNT_0013336979 /DNA_START=281 /DNA_END=2416 /DNA_ORIENTATION=+